MRGKDPGRGVIRNSRPPQRLLIAISVYHKSHLWTGINHLNPFEYRKTKNGAFRVESPKQEAGVTKIKFASAFRAIFGYLVNPFDIKDKMLPLLRTETEQEISSKKGEPEDIRRELPHVSRFRNSSLKALFCV